MLDVGRWKYRGKTVKQNKTMMIITIDDDDDEEEEIW